MTATRKIYLSGPISGNADFLDDFRIAEEIVNTRFPASYVINPAGLPISRYSGDIPHNVYMDFDLALLSRCDTIVLLPGFEHSKGAMIELEYAKAHCMDIFILGGDYGLRPQNQ